MQHKMQHMQNTCNINAKTCKISIGKKEHEKHADRLVTRGRRGRSHQIRPAIAAAKLARWSGIHRAWKNSSCASSSEAKKKDMKPKAVHWKTATKAWQLTSKISPSRARYEGNSLWNNVALDPRVVLSKTDRAEPPSLAATNHHESTVLQALANQESAIVSPPKNQWPWPIEFGLSGRWLRPGGTAAAPPWLRWGSWKSSSLGWCKICFARCVSTFG